MKFKIMQYNILNGFHTESYDKPELSVFQPNRLESAQKVVALEKPDILVLNETSFPEKRVGFPFVDYPVIFDFPYRFLAITGKNNGSMVFSRFPITGENYTQHYRTFYKTEIKVRRQSIYLDVAHPHPSLSDFDKKLFFHACLRDMKTPYILAGDFNACSDEDKYDREKMIKGFSLFDPNAEKTVDNFLQFQAIPEIRKHGLIDAYKIKNKKFDFTIPTDYLSKNKSTGIRMDYIFCSNDFKVSECYILKNEFTERASDHYPVVAVLEI